MKNIIIIIALALSEGDTAGCSLLLCDRMVTICREGGTRDPEMGLLRCDGIV